MYLLVPYRRRPDATRPVRELVVQGVASQPAGGVAPWDEAEVLGGHAVVLVAPHVDAGVRQQLAGRAGVLEFPDIGLMGRLGDALTTAGRRVIREAIEALGYTRAEVVAAIGRDPATARLGDVLALAGSRRRRPRYDEATDTVTVDGDVLPLARPIPGFAGGGAFPTTRVLDDFNRADTGPPPSASWTTGVFGGAGGHVITSNQATSSGTGADFYSWWNVSAPGPNCEAFVTVAAKPGNGQYAGVGVRAQSPGSAAADGYEADWLMAAGTDSIEAYRVDDKVYTLLGSAISQECTAGDQLGLRAIGSTLDIYRNGVSLATRSDATYATAGRIYLYSTDTTVRFDDYGGGTILSLPAVAPAQRRFQHLLVR